VLAGVSSVDVSELAVALSDETGDVDSADCDVSSEDDPHAVRVASPRREEMRRVVSLEITVRT
jgi:hypothetical protein